METLAKRVGARLRQIRTTQGLTLEQLSDLSGIPPESISRVERGRTLASLRTLDRLARGLAVELPALLSQDAPGPVDATSLPPEVRGIALLLAGKSPRTIEKVRRLIEVVLEYEAETVPTTETEEPSGAQIGG